MTPTPQFAPGGHRQRVVIIEDHRLQRERTAEVLMNAGGLAVVGQFETLTEFTRWLAQAPAAGWPHLVVLDLMVDRNAPADPAEVRKLVDEGVRVLVLSAMASPIVVRAMIRAGVAGFLSKRDSAQDIVDAVRTVLRGGSWNTPELAAAIAGDVKRPLLSSQEERVVVLYASGLTLDATAEHMGIQRETAKKYLERAKAKYLELDRPVRSKVDLYRAASQDGLLTDPTD